MKNNLQKGFHWDNDNFSTNLFSHPYNGGFYYSAARSNGMNYWQSGIYTFGGSMMWELIMENELVRAFGFPVHKLSCKNTCRNERRGYIKG